MALQLPLKTERLLLRDFEEEDWEAVHAYASDPDVVRDLPWGPNSVENTQGFVQARQQDKEAIPRNDFDLAVTLRDSGRLIGGCVIHVDQPQHKGCIGYCLCKSEWGKGYASEAVKAVVAFGFEYLALRRIFATCDPENVASIHVLEKVGMQREGHMRDGVFIRGIWRDSLLYAILEYGWKSLEQ